MSSVSVPDEATWLSLREANIGGSDVASLFYRWQLTDGTDAVYHLYESVPDGAELIECLSPHTTGYRLWQEKSGRLMPDDLAGVERVQAGVFLEPALAAWANHKWKWKLRKVLRYCLHEQVTGWGASLDYEVQEPGMPPVELKNVDFIQFRDNWVEAEGDIVMPPLNYVLQLQHQIGAVGADHGWIVACVAGNQLLRGRIERHEPTQTRIAEAVTAFWHGVKAGVEPTWLADYETVAETYRYGDKVAGTVDLSNVEDLPALCANYKVAKEQLDRAETAVSLLKGQIGTKLGTNSKATTVGFRLSWPVIERPEKEFPARIQKALTYRGGLSVTDLRK
jgi:hypothetical protein